MHSGNTAIYGLTPVRNQSKHVKCKLWLPNRIETPALTRRGRISSVNDGNPLTKTSWIFSISTNTSAQGGSVSSDSRFSLLANASCVCASSNFSVSDGFSGNNLRSSSIACYENASISSRISATAAIFPKYRAWSKTSPSKPILIGIRHLEHGVSF